MEFSFTDEQRMIAETAQAFFAENASSERTRKAMAADGIDRELWTAFCQELGLAGAAFPEKFGGADLGQVEFSTLAEAAGAQVAALPILGLTAVGHGLLASGDESVIADILPELISGEKIGAYAPSQNLTEKDGKISGEVKFVPHGHIADVFLFANDTEAWLVGKDAAGVKVTRHTTMDQTRPLATVSLDGVAATQLSGNAQMRTAAEQAAWLCLAAEALGGAQACIDRTVAYSQERVQFGRPIGSFQAYKHRLADMVVEIEQLRSAVYWAAAAMDDGSDETELALHSAKSFAAQCYHFCAGNMIQLHGGIGFTWEHDAHFFFKRARSIGSLYGSATWHQEQIAKMILGEAA